MIDFEFGRRNALGTVLSPLPGDETLFDITLKTNDVSLMTLTLPACDYSFSSFSLGERWSICASCDCGTNFLFGDTCFLLSRRELCDDDSGFNLKLTFESINSLLQWRKVAYNTTDANGNPIPQAQATNELADNLIKRIFRQNGGVAAQTGSYNLAIDPIRDLSAYITTEVDESLAPQATYTFGGQDLLSAMKSIADISNGKGTPLYFGIYQPSCASTALEFRTAVGQPGTARTIIVSPDNETMGNYCISEDNRNSANRIYVTDGNSAITVSDDPTLAAILAANPFALKESSASTAGTDPNSGPDLGSAELSRLSKIMSLDGMLKEGKSFKFGCDFFFGDRINAYAEGYNFSVVVDTLHFQQAAGFQLIEPSFSSQNSINSGSGQRALLARVKNLERSLARVLARV